jgi:para-aminobenzoate synthetase component 1
VTLQSVPAGAGLLAAFERLRGDGHAWLLDSALPDPRLGRFSFAGADPYWVLRAWGTRCELECRRSARPGFAVGRHTADADPLELMRALYPAPPDPGDDVPFPFAGGAVGFLGYELAEQIEPLGLRAHDELGLPDLVLLFVDRLLAFDHASGSLCAIGLGFAERADEANARARDSAAALVRQLDQAPHGDRRSRSAPTVRGAEPVAFDASTHAKAVDRIREEIGAGNVYQACLTHRMERHFDGDPWQLYTRLRRTNPAPFASYLELPEILLVSCSPERFLRLSGDGRVESRPIKGTRPRGSNASEDAAERRALELSEKDRAENLMIVDLVRNDLGRVCETGSVSVDDLFSVEAYASVFQMVTTVRGRLRDGCDVVDLLRATFPPGSMTGAPKIAAMRILDGLEPVRRSVYSGALGYFDARGGADLSVVIRTVLLRDGRAWVHSGGGIVADSLPEAEWREALDKARPLLDALEGS